MSTQSDLRNVSFAAVVSDDDSLDALNTYLKSSSLTEARVTRGSIDDAIDWLRRSSGSPQRLLVDISGRPMPLEDLDRLANACEPSVQVYVVGERNDVGLFRNMLRTGIEDYLIKPLTVELLRSVLDSEAGRRERRGKLVAVVGTRGGIGGTTIATGLVRDLAAGGERRQVVYIDLDLYGGSGASALGLAGGNALAEVLGNYARLDPTYLRRTLATNDQKLYVLAGELAFADVLEIDPEALRTVLDMLCKHFHYVVVDLPSGGGTLSNEIFSLASLACVVCDPSVHSARTLVRLVQHIESRPYPPTVYCVLNQHQPPVRGQVRVKDFLAAVEIPVQVTIEYDPAPVAQSENLAEPINPRSKIARGLRLLNDAVTGRSSTTQQQSWWERLWSTLRSRA